MNLLLMATKNFKPSLGGIAELGHGLAATLASCEHKVTVFAEYYPNVVNDDAQPYEVIRKPKIGVTQIVNEIRRIDAGTVFLLSIGCSWFPSRIATWVVRRPLGLYIHGLEITKRRGNPLVALMKRKLKAIMIRNTDYIYCNSSYVKGVVDDILGGNGEAVVVHPGITPDLVSYDKEIERPIAFRGIDLRNRQILLTIGRVVERKGIDTTLEAVAKLKESNPHLLYLVAGSGNEDFYSSLQKQAQELGVTEHVVFLGRFEDDEKDTLYRAANIFVMPSRILENGDVEGFGIVYIEANLYELPVIGGREGGVLDAVQHGCSGYLVDPRDPDQIAERIDELLQNSSQALRLGECGRRRAIEHFSWERIAVDFLTNINRKGYDPRVSIARSRLGLEQEYLKELDALPKHEPINRENACRNLLDFQRFLEKHGFRYYLFFGTLLGAVREGDFIAHDTDTDIGMFMAERERLMDLLPELEELGLRLVKTAKEDRVVSIYRDGDYIDLYFAVQRRMYGRRKWYLDYSSVPYKLLRSFSRIDFLGSTFPVPADYSAVLRQLYGPDWHVSKVGYEAGHDMWMKLLRFLRGSGKIDRVKRFFSWRKDR